MIDTPPRLPSRKHRSGQHFCANRWRSLVSWEVIRIVMPSLGPDVTFRGEAELGERQFAVPRSIMTPERTFKRRYANVEGEEFFHRNAG